MSIMEGTLASLEAFTLANAPSIEREPSMRGSWSRAILCCRWIDRRVQPSRWVGVCEALGSCIQGEIWRVRRSCAMLGNPVDLLGGIVRQMNIYTSYDTRENEGLSSRGTYSELCFNLCEEATYSEPPRVSPVSP